MTETAAPNPRGKSLAEIPDVRPIAVAALIGAVAGIWWFPLWFLAAQLLRIWGTRGGLKWLSSRGVAEYEDEKIAMIVSIVAIGLVAVRLIVAVDWLQTFTIFDTKQLTPHTGDLQALMDLVLGISIATAFTGVLVTRRLPWLFALAGFSVVLTLSAAAARGVFWQPNGFEAVPLALLGYLSSKIATLWDSRANRRYEVPVEEEQRPPDTLRWTEVSRTKRSRRLWDRRG